MFHLIFPKFNPCSWKSLGEPKTGCAPFCLSLADSRKLAQTNKIYLRMLDISREKIDSYTNILPSASWKTLFAILRTISNFNLDWEAPTVSPICKIGFAPPHKVLLRFFLRSVSSKTFSLFAKYHFWGSSASLFGRDQICSAEVPDQNWCFTKLSSSRSSFSSSGNIMIYMINIMI